jgi:hypothetical protein
VSEAPLYGCVDSNISISNTSVIGAGLNGQWTCPNSTVTFSSRYCHSRRSVCLQFFSFNSSSPSTMFVSSSIGTVPVTWTAGSCIWSTSVTIIGPPIANIPFLTQQLCGSAGSARVGVDLFGDATNGNWSAVSSSSVSFSNDKSAFTLISWTASGAVTLQFTPNSVCYAPASLTVTIEPTCPQVLSREATIGIAVGATLGGLVLIAAGVFAAIKLYQVWNRSLVKFRNKEDVSMAKTEYKF